METYTVTIYRRGTREFNKLSGLTLAQIETLKKTQEGTEYYTVIDMKETK